MSTSLTPSKLPILDCPSRYARQYLRSEPVIAPFLVTHLGSEVHERIAQSLESGRAPSTAPFRLPARALLVAAQSVDDLVSRSLLALEEFRREHLPHLGGGIVECPVKLDLDTSAGPVTVNARLDYLAVSRNRASITDWKSGQLRDVRMQLATAVVWAHRALGLGSVTARAVSLSTGREESLEWSPDLEAEVADTYGAAATALARVAAGEAPAVPGRGCMWCPYALSCDAVGEPPWALVNTRTGEVSEVTREVVQA